MLPLIVLLCILSKNNGNKVKYKLFLLYNSVIQTFSIGATQDEDLQNDEDENDDERDEKKKKMAKVKKKLKILKK